MPIDLMIFAEMVTTEKFLRKRLQRRLNRKFCL